VLPFVIAHPSQSTVPVAAQGYPHDPSELLIDCEEAPMLAGGLVGMPREAD